MEFGVQIFGCLAECKKDPEAFFKDLAASGYHQIEPCILFDDPVQMAEEAKKSGNKFLEQLAENIWKPDELPYYLKLMDKYGLALSSVHIFTGSISRSTDKMIETAKQNHITAYVVNCNQETVASDYAEFAEECSSFSDRLKEHGIELWIHNNGAEIKARVEYQGKKVPALSAILDLCKKSGVGAQIDVGWVLYGGIEPAEYLQEVKEYLRSVHFKDLKKDFAQRSDGDIFACLGDGALNVKEILGCVPADSGITVLVDQDASDGDIMEDMHKSCKVLLEASGTRI